MCGEGKLGLGIEGQYHFGNKVKENDLLNSLLSSGFMVGDDGDLVPVGFEQRGMSLMTWLSKNFPFSPKSPNSGLLIKVNMGMGLHIASKSVITWIATQCLSLVHSIAQGMIV